MKPGKAFEIFIKNLLINVGFSAVPSDGIYIFDGAAGQMVQGLGEAHNADVLLEPPVQTPFYSLSRLLIECKDYQKKVGLDKLRGALGLREDINHFDIVDVDKLKARRTQSRRKPIYNYDRYSYQVAVASLSGFTNQAQEFAATYRIPLIDFSQLSFWHEFCDLIGFRSVKDNHNDCYVSTDIAEWQIEDFAAKIGQRMAIAVTNSGQLLFLYHVNEAEHSFSQEYSLYWSSPDDPWELQTGQQRYQFCLPPRILERWLLSASDDLSLKQRAIACKAAYLSNMVVYYSLKGKADIKMISIDSYTLKEAKRKLNI